MESVKLVLPESKSSNVQIVWNPTLKVYESGIYSANLVNNYFSNIGRNLAEKIGRPDTEFHPPEAECQFVWGGFITVPEVYRLLCQASVSKSSGIPDLSSKLLIDCLKSKVNVLTEIFNNCLIIGTFPMDWKVSIMVPIPKKPNAKVLNALRPISLIPLPGKLFEQLIHKFLYPYFETNGLLCEQQGGFSSGKRHLSNHF